MSKLQYYKTENCSQVFQSNYFYVPKFVTLHIKNEKWKETENKYFTFLHYIFCFLLFAFFILPSVQASDIDNIKSKLEPGRSVEYINVKGKNIPLITKAQDENVKNIQDSGKYEISYIISYKKFLSGAKIDNLSKILNETNIKYAKVFRNGYFISLRTDYDKLKALLEVLSGVIEIQYVQETPVKTINDNQPKTTFDRSISQKDVTQFSPDDPYFKDQWYLNNYNNPVLDLGYLGYKKYLTNPESKILQSNNNPPVVAIIDVGIFYNTPELKDRIYVNKGEIPNNGIDDDNNGYIDDYMGVDVGHPECSLESCIDKYQEHHGTLMFSIMAAKSNNNLYMTGILPDVIKVLPVSASNNYTQVDRYNEAYDYILTMKKNGVNIISVNVSAGGPFDPVENEYMQKYLESDIMVIAAAGNNGKNLDKNPVYPANYNADNILAIGAMDEEGKPANFSNYGKSVDLYMPGYNIIAITYPENIVTGAGTSQAAAVTSGVFGAAAYLYPACSPLELKNLLLETAFNVGSFTVSRNINLRFLPANKTVYQMNMAKISDIGGVGLITDGHLQSGGCSGNGIGY